MRPRYEKKVDLTNEVAVMNELAKKFDCTYYKLPVKYGVDFAAVRDGVIVAFVEVKCRSVSKDTYSSYILSLGKIMSACNLQAVTGIPVILAVRWVDATAWTNICQQFKYVIGGRKDREDWQDIEPVASIPMAAFTEL